MNNRTADDLKHKLSCPKCDDKCIIMGGTEDCDNCEYCGTDEREQYDEEPLDL